MDNILNARIKLKYDTLENWQASSITDPPFKPLAGEVCIAYIGTDNAIAGNGDGTQTNQPRAVGIKVGDGSHPFSQLPWIQAAAADVYTWAKQMNKPVYDATEINNTSIEKKDVILNSSSTAKATVQEVLAWLKDQIDSMGGGAGSIATQIDTKIGLLDVDNDTTSSLAHHITGFDPSKTLATLTEQNGYIDATFQNIQIAESQVTGASGGWITDGLAAKAPLASPALTGTPTAPTAAAGTNTTQIATTAFVTNAVAGLSGAMHYIGAVTANPTTTAPSGTFSAGDVVTYNNSEYVYDGTTWRELGTEGDYAIKGSIRDADIANDANIAQSKISGLTTALAEKAPLNNPTFTGTVTVPTPTNNTDAATKAYVDTAAASANTTYNISWSATGTNAEKLVLTPTTNGVSGTQQTVNLKKVATTADIYDLENAVTTTSVPSDNNVARTAKYFVWDCGDATHLVD